MRALHDLLEGGDPGSDRNVWNDNRQGQSRLGFASQFPRGRLFEWRPFQFRFEDWWSALDKGKTRRQGHVGYRRLIMSKRWQHL
jgi:hypothetical protein